MKLFRAFAIAFAGGLIAAAVAYNWTPWYANVLHWTGSDNTAGVEYGFWSGFGSDIAELALLGGLVAAYRRAECAVSTCHRIGLHHVLGTNARACKKHHPAGGVTQDHLKAHHDAAMAATVRSAVE